MSDALCKAARNYDDLWGVCEAVPALAALEAELRVARGDVAVEKLVAAGYLAERDAARAEVASLRDQLKCAEEYAREKAAERWADGDYPGGYAAQFADAVREYRKGGGK